MQALTAQGKEKNRSTTSGKKKLRKLALKVQVRLKRNIYTALKIVVGWFFFFLNPVKKKLSRIEETESANI